MNLLTKLALGWDENMRYGVRKYEGASCLVSNCTAVPEKMRKDIREISQVECKITERGQGHATKLLDDICREADAKRMILVLSVEPFGDIPPLSKEQLQEWYCTSFDFNILQEQPLMLVRMFNPFPESKMTR